MILRERSYLVEAKGQKRPPKKQVDALIKAYAVMSEYRRQGGQFGGRDARLDQRLYDRFWDKHRRMSEKYPYIDMSSDAFWRKFKDAAEKYRREHPIHAGKDW